MATLRKKQSAILSAKSARPIMGSPASKSEQGGGVRLDVGFGDLTLESPQRSVAYEPPHVRNGHGSPALPQQKGVNALKDTSFQLGKIPEDGDVFLSPRRSPRAPEARSSALTVVPAPETLGATMQGVVPTTQLVPMLRGRDSAADVGIGARAGSVDAQTFYPATACVFVANLPDYVGDARLEIELTRAFSKYGIVFVKIRRDQRNMPFAFCQYTKDEDAHTAMLNGKGTLIEGRACRTEMVKANRSFIMYNVHGRDIDINDAESQMSDFGPISRCEILHPQIQEAMGVRGGVLVEYDNFDPARDVIAAYRRHPSYRVVAYDLKKPVSSAHVDPDMAWLRRYEVDRRSIFVGHLPADAPNPEELLTELASEVGEVAKVQVVRKDARIAGRFGPVTFGFVEFSRPDMADIAVRELNGRQYNGSTLRVERKASREPPPSTRRVRPEIASLADTKQQSPLSAKRIENRVEKRIESRVAKRIENRVENRVESRVERRVGNQKAPTAAKTVEPVAQEPATPTPLRAAEADVAMPSSVSSKGTMPSAPPSSYRALPYGIVPYPSQSYTGSSFGGIAPYQAHQLSYQANAHFAPYQAGSHTGSYIGSHAGSHTGSHAGSHAGSQVGSQVGSHAGSHAGSQVSTGHYPVGPYPETPQATPGMMVYGTPYSWATPYLQDPQYAQMAYYHTYSSPLVAMPNAHDGDDNDVTPTKHGVSGGPEGALGQSEEAQADSPNKV
ncbi:hypothetical protein F4677DRAFT_457660 [Hypoxylon crocopeplum]|nr:hypothetical protein F4677DRAFT_457660 [Hypoxylon crocopeplum]